MEDSWLTYAKRLQAIAATGLHYDPRPYDRERFAEVDLIAREMISQLGKIPLQHLAGMPATHEGYATPKIDVRAAVFRDGRILLVREISDGKWTMPGGFADIGLTASEVAVKETWEEANLRVRAQKLFCLRHRAKQTGEPDFRDFYKFFFLCEAFGTDAPSPGPETSEAAYFAPDDLPEMSQGRSNPTDVARALRHHLKPGEPTEFD